MNDTKGMLIIVSGPSGVGKDTVVEQYLAENPSCVLSVSATTRAPRSGEVEGVDYFFLQTEEFENLISSNQMLEYAAYNKHYYGTPKQMVEQTRAEGKHVILVIEVQGAKLVRERVPEAVSIFIAPPSMEELERRLRGRGTDSEASIACRMETACQEVPCAKDYDYVIHNHTLSQAVSDFSAIVHAAECSPHYSPSILKGVCHPC